jgi:hypothetical protein
MTYRVVSIPGDGVGPEVLAAGRRVLEAAGERYGFGFAWDEVLMGGVAIDAYGVAIRPDDIASCAAADAVFLGAVGGPKWDDPNAAVRPEQGLLALRKALTLYANLRPVSVHPALVASAPLRPDLLQGVDLLIVRELTGGLYFGRPSEERQTPEGKERLLRADPRVRVVPLRAADRAQEDRIAGLRDGEVLGPEGDPVGIDRRPAGEELRPRDGEAESPTGRVDDRPRGRDDLGTDAVARDCRDLEPGIGHGSSSAVRWTTKAGEAGPISAPWSLLVATR